MSIAVNGKTIEDKAIAAEAQNHPASGPDEAWEDAAYALAVRELLLQEAHRLGLKADEVRDAEGRLLMPEEALIETLLEQEVVAPRADEAACKRYYQNNRKRFRTPDLFEARHILLPAPPEDEAACRRAAAQAEALIEEITADPSRFAALAKAYSKCPSAEAGGNLGQLQKGQTVPEFETFLFELEEGQLCPVPVKTRFGAHVLLLERRIEGRQLPFEEVAGRISAYLEEASWRRAVAQYIAILAGQADIQGIDMEGAKSPLVQ
ncbi:peptidylprolyl isomerase [Tepidicaulis sp. LMO-SS28]|uniref:peptidylprolyl isomerase n=1 Tax=Tepidicaulis sp. LMO-SS28 TaxID=3447455 RepID=UPI003EDF2A9F